MKREEKKKCTEQKEKETTQMQDLPVKASSHDFRSQHSTATCLARASHCSHHLPTPPLLTRVIPTPTASPGAPGQSENSFSLFDFLFTVFQGTI